MADYAPNFTPRWIVRYRAAGIEHDIMVRVARGIAGDGIRIAGDPIIGDIFPNLATILAEDFEAIAAWYIEQDSDVRVLSTTGVAVSGAWDFTPASGVQKVTAATFSGNAAGSKVRYSVYGLNLSQDLASNQAGDGIVTGAELSVIADVVSDLNASTAVRAINNVRPVFYNRVTVKVNDHLLKLVRRGLIG